MNTRIELHLNSLKYKCLNFHDYYITLRVRNSDSHPLALNRFGMQTVASGSVRFRYSVIKTEPALAKSSSIMSAIEETQLKQKKTVDDILQSFRASGTFSRGLSPLARSLDSTMSSSFDQAAISKVLGSTGTTNAARVAELLAKSRAKSVTPADAKQSSRSSSGDKKFDRPTSAVQKSLLETSIAEGKYEDDSEPLMGGGSVHRIGSKAVDFSKTTTANRTVAADSDDDESSGLLSKTVELGELKGFRR